MTAFLLFSVSVVLLFTAIYLWARPCQHKHVSFPQSNRQRCLDCGAWRRYVIGTEPGDIHAGDWLEDIQLRRREVRCGSHVS